MERRPTRSDVAKRAGVSKTTVTFVLGNRPGVTIPEATRDRVRQAAQELGYQPSAIAKALVSGRTNTITLAFPNLFVPNYCRMLRAFESMANVHGYHLIAGTIGHVGATTAMPDLVSLLNSPCDAVVLVDAHELIRPHLDEIMPFYKPVIAMGIYDVPQTDCVEIDMIPSMTSALTHLLDAKPRRLAFFGFGSAEEATLVLADALVGRGDPRVVKYVGLMNAVGRPIEVIHGSHLGRRANVECLQEYIKDKGCPDAIMCYDDEHAISAHYGLRRIGKKLPDDVLIVGMDGNEECEYLEPPVSTIAMPVDQMCAHTWEFLVNRLNGSDDARQYVRLNAELVIRESSCRPERHPLQTGQE